MAAPTDMQHEKRPGVYVFRNRFSRRQRKWWMFGCACLVLLLNSAALIVWRQPDLSLDVKADWAVGLHALSWFPILLCFVAWISPQFILRVSPRGVAYANTRWACFPWTRRRWHVQWWEIDRLKWCGGRCELMVRRRKRIIQYAVFKKDQPRVAQVLGVYLSERFDLTHGTVEHRFRQREREQWREMRLWRKVADRLLLIFVAVGCSGHFALIGYSFGYVLLPTVGALMSIAAVGVVVLQVCRRSRFGWQEPVHALA